MALYLSAVCPLVVLLVIVRCTASKKIRLFSSSYQTGVCKILDSKSDHQWLYRRCHNLPVKNTRSFSSNKKLLAISHHLNISPLAAAAPTPRSPEACTLAPLAPAFPELPLQPLRLQEDITVTALVGVGKTSPGVTWPKLVQVPNTFRVIWLLKAGSQTSQIERKEKYQLSGFFWVGDVFFVHGKKKMSNFWEDLFLNKPSNHHLRVLKKTTPKSCEAVGFGCLKSCTTFD